MGRVMERGSTKHGPGLDESMASEVASITHGAPVESRADESREAEPVDVDALGSDLRDDVAEPETPTALSHEDVTARSEIARFIPPSTYPASADELLAAARAEGATAPVVAALERLDPSRYYETLQQVWETLGGDTEHRVRDADVVAERSAGAVPDDASRPSAPAPSVRPEEPAQNAARRETPSNEAPGGGLTAVPAAAVRFGVELAALATWTVAGVVTSVARRVDQLRERIDEGTGGR